MRLWPLEDSSAGLACTQDPEAQAESLCVDQSRLEPPRMVHVDGLPRERLQAVVPASRVSVGPVSFIPPKGSFTYVMPGSRSCIARVAPGESGDSCNHSYLA